jgi:hypothetical protein
MAKIETFGLSWKLNKIQRQMAQTSDPTRRAELERKIPDLSAQIAFSKKRVSDIDLVIREKKKALLSVEAQEQVGRLIDQNPGRGHEIARMYIRRYGFDLSPSERSKAVENLLDHLYTPLHVNRETLAARRLRELKLQNHAVADLKQRPSIGMG